MKINQIASEIRLGSKFPIGDTIYKVEGIEDDHSEEEITLTLKPNGKTYLSPDDFVYLTMNYRHMVSVEVD